MKKLISLILVISMTLVFVVGCGQKPKENDETQNNTKNESKEDVKKDQDDKKEVVELHIPHYKAGQNVGGKFFLPQVDRFNKKYEGKYKVIIEELPQDSYFEKIKQLAIQDKLPPLIEGADKDWFEKVIISNNKYYDLSDWLDSKPEIKSALIEDALEYNTKDGKVVSMPLIVTRPIGLYYNSTMMNPSKRIGEMTLEEFEGELGENKLAFMTAENAWTTSLFLTSLVAAEEGGVEILKKGAEERVTDFTSDAWVNAFTKLQKFLQEHASSNTLGAAYADAANSFMSKKSAVICNGPWMVGDFAEEASDKWSNDFNGDQVKGDIYPGNIAVANVNGYGWWIPSGLPEDVTEGALAFLEFINSPEELEAYMLAEGGTAPNLTTSEDFNTKLKENRILSELSTAVNKDTKLVPGCTDIMPSSIAEQEFPKLLPKLIDGSLTPEQFAKELTEKAKEAVE
jgi:raffinose/stachyose/melibiose transport system substrate-binding protein